MLLLDVSHCFLSMLYSQSFLTEFVWIISDGSCTGLSWTTNGTQGVIPATFQDTLSSVSC